MITRLWKLNFTTGVHFGTGGLAKGTFTMMADTLFSALCIEAVSRKDGSLEKLVSCVQNNELRIADLLPYEGSRYYLPKPLCDIPHGEHIDIMREKVLRKIDYLSIDELGVFLDGTLSHETAHGLSLAHRLGHSVLMQKAVIAREVTGEDGLSATETKPYGVQVYTFAKGNGLYLLAQAKTEELLDFLEELLDSLGVTGIGGKISSGYGKYDLFTASVPETLAKQLDSTDGHLFMTLSCCIPAEQEMVSAMKDAGYRLEKRGGFVQSNTYSNTPLKKRDLFLMTAGSVFKAPFSGELPDVAVSGTHPIYRYAKPLWLRLM